MRSHFVFFCAEQLSCVIFVMLRGTE